MSETKLKKDRYYFVSITVESFHGFTDVSLNLDSQLES